MISPSYQNNSREETVGYNVSCFDDSYVSDDDFSVEQSAQTNIKRQKMTEEERLTRCRERNRVHARNTRERKKSQMDGLQSRIQELVDEKKRLNSTASESSIASILMSLAGFGLPNIDGADKSAKSDCGDKNYLSMLPFKVDDDEDDIAISIEKLKMQVSALLGDEDCKDILDADPLLLKDKSTCSTSELEMIRRERNRMHAKKTRLRKKKMIQEMETIIASLEKEITDLQGGMTSIFPTRPETVMDVSPQQATLPDALEKKFVISSANYTAQERPNAVTVPEIKMEMLDTPLERDSHLTRTISVDAPSSSCSKKRKHLALPTGIDCRAKHFSTPKFEPYEPAESADISQAEDDRGLQQYLWRQHTAKNSVKTVSICSESASGSSEGSLSEGDLSSGSAVHSLLHMSRTNSSDSRGSGSGSDESDAAPSEHVTAPCSQTTFQPHSRNHVHSARTGEKRVGAPAAYTAIASPTAPITTPKTIQAILAACESKGPAVYATLPPAHQMQEQPGCVQSHPHWRFPERVGGPIGTDIRIAASTVAAVASIYPLHGTVADPPSYRGFIPMKAVEGPVFYPTGTEVSRNHNFTVYGGLRPANNSSADLSNLPSKKRALHAPFQEANRFKGIPQELDVTESPAYESVPSPSQVYSIFVPEQAQERSNQQLQERQHSTSNVMVKSFTDCSTAPHPFTGRSRDVKKIPSTTHSHTEITNDMKEATLKASSYRPVLPEGVLDYSSFKSSELMPPSL